MIIRHRACHGEACSAKSHSKCSQQGSQTSAWGYLKLTGPWTIFFESNILMTKQYPVCSRNVGLSYVAQMPEKKPGNPSNPWPRNTLPNIPSIGSPAPLPPPRPRARPATVKPFRKHPPYGAQKKILIFFPYFQWIWLLLFFSLFFSLFVSLFPP